jgi:Na+-translocating ferredoxin:NAD+ oxidoreductase subunit G
VPQSVRFQLKEVVMNRAMVSSFRMLVIMFLSLECFLLTSEAASDQARRTQEIERTWLLAQALPGADRFETREKGGIQYEVAYRGEEVVGGVFYTEGVGYGGLMRFLVGLDSEGRVEGVILVSHRETSKLGTKITDPVFLSQFRGRRGPFILKRDHPSGNIDGVAGATRSTRGLIMALEEAVQTFKKVWGKAEGR